MTTAKSKPIRLGAYSARAFEIVRTVVDLLGRRIGNMPATAHLGVFRDDDGEVCLDTTYLLEACVPDRTRIANDIRGAVWSAAAGKKAADEIYCLADIVQGRKPCAIARKYGKAMVDAIAGQQRNPFQIELAKLRAQDVKDAAAEQYDEREKAMEAYRADLAALEKRHGEILKKIDDDFDAKKAEIDGRYAELGFVD